MTLGLVACQPARQAKSAYIWIDGPGNFREYANSRENIARDCQRIADMGFTDIIVDVRPTGGNVLFRSTVAPQMTFVPRLVDGQVKIEERTADFDYLAAFIASGHAAGLRVHAAVNTMVGAWRVGDYKTGMLYDHPELRDWCTVDNTPSGLINQMDDPDTKGARFLDPANPQVQTFLLTMLGELAAYEGLDGIVLDRCRYDDYAMDAGYTEVARKAFAEYIGREPEQWPVFPERGMVFLEGDPTPLQNQWLTFRCQVIHDFVAKAASTVHSVAPDIQFGIYVGAWFSEYYRSGVNWTSPHYDLVKNEPTFWWATPAYQATGFADLVDYLFLGAYTEADDIHGDKEWTMEGFAKLGRKRLCGETPFACGPDIGNPVGFTQGGRQDIIPEIARTMQSTADGLFVFDLCHLRKYDYWDAFREGLRK